jgi:hypothetical protein
MESDKFFHKFTFICLTSAAGFVACYIPCLIALGYYYCRHNRRAIMYCCDLEYIQDDKVNLFNEGRNKEIEKCEKSGKGECFERLCS